MSWEGVLEGLRSSVVWLMDITSVPILVYFTVINLSYLTLIVLAAVDFRAQHRRREAVVETFGGALTPGVSLLVPAYNEEVGIVTSVQALLSLRYPRHEVVVIDDGSTDATFERLRAAFDLVPIPRVIPQDVPIKARVVDVHVPRDGRTRLVVVRKENSGRSEALNVGINAANEPLVAMIDADSILEPDALLRVTQPFADDPIRMVAAGGAIRPVNGSRPRSSGVIASCTTTCTHHACRAASRSRRRISLSSVGSALTCRKRRPATLGWWSQAPESPSSPASGQNRVAGDGHASSQGRSASATSVHSCPSGRLSRGARVRRARTVTVPPARQRASKTRRAESSAGGGSAKSSMSPSSLRRRRARRRISSGAGPV